jgi:beta-N-acetylhexosaminidase
MKGFLVSVAVLLVFKVTLNGQNQQNPVPIEKKAAQMLMFGFRDTIVTNQSDAGRWVGSLGIGGVIIYEYDGPSKSRPRNITSAPQLWKLTSDLQLKAEIPLFIGIDEEGGKVCRLKPRYGFLPSVSAKYLGQLNIEDSTRFYANRIAGNCKRVGINLNFAPDADVDINPDCPVIGRLERSFSGDPMVVTQQVTWFIDEHTKQGVWCSLKHFPGHGSAKMDSHLGFTDVTDSWKNIELQPFEWLLKGQNYPMVMTAHVFNRQLDSIYPATLSRKTLSILRDSMQYNGLILSDDMMMGAIASQFGLEEAIFRAIDAGVDVLLFSNNIDVYDNQMPEKVIAIIIKLIKEGKLSEQRIDESYKHIMLYKKGLKF